MEQSQLLNNPKIVIKQEQKTVVNGFESITSKLRKSSTRGGRGSSVNDAINKIYISLQPRGSGNKENPKPTVAIYFGKNICTKARFMKGDIIEVLYSKLSKTWWFRRTNDNSKGYTLSTTGGREQEKSSTFVVKTAYDISFYPTLQLGVNHFKQISSDERGIFCS